MAANQGQRLRLPLQTGHGLFLALCGLAGVQLLLSVGTKWTRNDFVMFLMWGLIPALGVFALWRVRASDILLDRAGFLVVGGRHDKLAKSWEELAAATCGVRRERFGYSLWLRGNFAMFVPLVTTISAKELQSLEALLVSLRTWDQRHQPGAPPATVSVEVFRCGVCGAALSPHDSAQVQCGYCRHWVPVPPAVAQLARAARTEVSALGEREVRDLLRQRGAGTVNLLALVIILLLPAMPHGLHVEIQFAPVTLAIFGCLLLLLRALLVDRQALGLLTTSFGARAPRAPGAAHDCRVCGAPLPEVPGTDQLLWRCVYCRSDNIVGLELAAETSMAVTERRSLRDALGGRRLARPALLLGMLALMLTAAYLTTTIDIRLTLRELYRQWR